jgi:outer membrane autotransporter protein
MLGYDTPLNDATRVGVGVRYARSTLDAKISDSQSSINSYQAMAYLGYSPGPWFANAALVYGLDHYSGSRHAAFPGVDETAKANYSGSQFTAFGAAGYHFYIDDEQTVITPMASLQYTSLRVDAYTETGGNAINLMIDAQNYGFAQSGLGLKIARDFILSDARIFRPEVHANLLYSFGDETMANSATFASGGQGFTTVGLRPERSTYDVGAGVVFAGSETWSVKGIYDYLWSSRNYTANQVTIKFVLRI